MKDRKGSNSLSVDKTLLVLESQSVFAKVASGFQAGDSGHHRNKGFHFLYRNPRLNQNHSQSSRTWKPIGIRREKQRC